MNHGELTDAPGRNEVWDHYLAYLPNGQWELITESTDFSGMVNAAPTKEVMGSRKLLSWVLDRDSEMSDENSPATSDEDVKKLGLFTTRLNEIAIEVGSDYCAALIVRWLSGDWPPGTKTKKLVVRNVNGVTKRGVWIRIYHCVYLVNTNLGPAYMYEPDVDGHAKVILKTDSSMSQGRLVKVPKSILAQVKNFQPTMDFLKTENT